MLSVWLRHSLAVLFFFLRWLPYLRFSCLSQVSYDCVLLRLLLRDNIDASSGVFVCVKIPLSCSASRWCSTRSNLLSLDFSIGDFYGCPDCSWLGLFPYLPSFCDVIVQVQYKQLYCLYVCSKIVFFYWKWRIIWVLKTIIPDNIVVPPLWRLQYCDGNVCTKKNRFPISIKLSVFKRSWI